MGECWILLERLLGSKGSRDKRGKKGQGVKGFIGVLCNWDYFILVWETMFWEQIRGNENDCCLA